MRVRALDDECYDDPWGGGEPPPPAPPQPTPPQGPSGAAYLGFNQAISDLNKPNCAAVVEGSSDQTSTQLAADLNNAQVTTGTDNGNGPVIVNATVNADGSTSYSYSYQWAYTSGGNIQLNANYFPDPTKLNINVGGTMMSLLGVVNQTLNQNLTAQQFGALVFLHELSHMVSGIPASLIDSNAFNNLIIQDCIQ